MEEFVIGFFVANFEELENILKAEEYLNGTGINFDTGYDMTGQIRYWHLNNEIKNISVIKKEVKE